MKKILVTGGSGHIGAYLASRLLGDGHHVVLLDREKNTELIELVHGAARLDALAWEPCDVTSAAQLYRAVAAHRPASIVHLASLMPPVVEIDAKVALDQVTGGLLNVLEAARLFDVGRVVWSSATSVFGPPQHHGGIEAPVGDTAPHYPASLYGISKSAAERMAALYRNRYGVDSLGFRFCQGYGPGKRRGRPFGYQMFEKAILGEPCDVPYGDDIINWQYVEDIAAILAKAIDAPYRGIDVYNTSGEVLSMGATLDLMRELVPGCKLRPLHGTAEIVWRYDAARVAADLGLAPPTPVREGFARTIDTMRAWRAKGVW